MRHDKSRIIRLLFIVCVLSYIVRTHTDFFSPAAIAHDYEGVYETSQAGTFDISGEIGFSKLPDELFLGDGTVYSPELSNASALLSMLAYSAYSGKASHVLLEGEEYDLEAVLSLLGFEDVRDVEISKGVLDIHRTEIFLAHRGLTESKGKREVLAVIIRGTNGSLQEWASNFDLGNEYDEGDDRLNHAGFEYTADSVLEAVADYVQELGLTGICYWLTGHSRGAAVADLAAAKLVMAGEKAIAYTYAAPCATLDEDRNDESYNSIFNILNREDLIPRVPFESWGYGLYGRTIMIEPDEELKQSFTEAVSVAGEPMVYSGDREWLENLIYSLSKMIPDGRNPVDGIYELSCEHVTGVEGSGISISVNTAMAEYYFGLLPEKVREAGHIIKDEKNAGHSYICIPPIGIIRIFGAMISDRDMGTLDRLALFNFLGKYEPLELLINSMREMMSEDKVSSPHIPYTYYLLQKELGTKEVEEILLEAEKEEAGGESEENEPDKEDPKEREESGDESEGNEPDEDNPDKEASPDEEMAEDDIHGAWTIMLIAVLSLITMTVVIIIIRRMLGSKQNKGSKGV